MPGSGDNKKEKDKDKDAASPNKAANRVRGGNSAPKSPTSPTSTRVTRQTPSSMSSNDPPPTSTGLPASQDELRDRRRPSSNPAAAEETFSTSRITRKRAASLQSGPEQQQTVYTQQAPFSAPVTSGSRTPDSASQFCICQPDSKIPRPRNAFILYRQHHQGSVQARNPTLANPDISKILGQQWNGESKEIRAQWDALANEEKQRHSTAYPGYKYQPKRKGRKGGSVSSVLDTASGDAFDELPLCPKCGKRSIMPPPTPASAITSGPGPPSLTPTSRPQPSPPPGHNSPFPTLRQSTRHGSHTSARNFFPDRSYSTHSLSSPSSATWESYYPLSPDTKRRRTSYHPTPPYYSAPSPTTHYSHRYGSPPRRPQPPQSMGPPPRPHDPSLTLAPIQTTTQAAAAHARSVQALVMTISYASKLATLHRIAPSLRAPGPASPPHAIRGAIVAIDAEDPDLIRSYADFFRAALAFNDDFALQSFEPPLEALDPGGSVTSIAHSSANFFVQRDISDYYSLMIRWREIARDLIAYVTTPPSLARNAHAQQQQQLMLPVALVPGYALSTANTWASCLPITDEYTPVDHWTWVATLWRDVVGADVTVWIRRCMRSEIDQLGDVEVRRDMATVVIRICDGEKEDEKESRQRRAAFEVGELIRGVGRREEG